MTILCSGYNISHGLIKSSRSLKELVEPGTDWTIRLIELQGLSGSLDVGQIWTLSESQCAFYKCEELVIESYLKKRLYFDWTWCLAWQFPLLCLKIEGLHPTHLSCFSGKITRLGSFTLSHRSPELQLFAGFPQAWFSLVLSSSLLPSLSTFQQVERRKGRTWPCHSLR